MSLSAFFHLGPSLPLGSTYSGMASLPLGSTIAFAGGRSNNGLANGRSVYVFSTDQWKWLVSGKTAERRVSVMAVPVDKDDFACTAT